MWTTEIMIALILSGALAGFLAGLLGVGGGTIIVPIVLWLLHKQGVVSEYTQHKKSINWPIVKYLSPAVIFGGLLGSALSKYLPALFLKIFFVIFLYLIAIQMLLKLKPKPTRQLPQPAGLFGIGNVIGVLSSWVGIGGGSLSVPFMTYCNVPIHLATGTSAALAWTISVAGLLGYVYSGWHIQGLPEHTLGFVYLPVVVALSVCTVIFAPLGVKVSHQLSPDKLKMTMGILLFLIATQMVWKMLA